MDWYHENPGRAKLLARLSAECGGLRHPVVCSPLWRSTPPLAEATFKMIIRYQRWEYYAEKAKHGD